MPVNLVVPDDIHAVAGVTLSGRHSGLKSDGNLDTVLIVFEPGTSTAGVFTRNSFCAAPITVCRDHLRQNKGDVRALLINSGGANAATGAEGERISRQTCQWVAQQLADQQVKTEAVLPFSTGVIGEQLPESKFEQAIPALKSALARDAWIDAALGIMTTDMSPKIVSRRVQLSSGVITLNGIAKGSGMIQPDMATMLAFMMTDASVDAADLQVCLSEICERTFNSVTVDGDTSTNDSCTLSATGKSGIQISPASVDWPLFEQAVYSLALELAQAIVRDGEGATKFITINVSGGASPGECKQVGLTVANSPLVKTAFFASDANLGRIIMAVGRSRDDLELTSFSLSIDDVDVFEKGQPASTYTEKRGSAAMQKAEIAINIELGRGESTWSVWTCDLSHEYVTINSAYRS